MSARRIDITAMAAPVTEYLGFAAITLGVALYEGAGPLAAIPVVVVAATVKTLWAKAHRRMFHKPESQ